MTPRTCCYCGRPTGACWVMPCLTLQSLLDADRARGLKSWAKRSGVVLVPKEVPKVKQRIQEAYAACYKLCESDRDAVAWLERSLDAARRGEAQHRKAGARFADGLARYKLPIADAARFFVVKWFLETPLGTGTAADFCGMREDCLFASGARDRICREKGVPAWEAVADRFADVAGLDYSEVFAA